MSLLALDTCLGAVSVALVWRNSSGRTSLVARRKLCRAGHAELVMPMIADVLTESGVTARELRRIAVTLGPGTFTGVRTGIAAARGLALAAGADVVGTSSLAVIAAGVVDDVSSRSLDAHVAVAVDARKGDVFLQLFESSGAPLTEAELLPLTDAVVRLAGGRWTVAGSAAANLCAEAAAQGIDISHCDPAREPDARDLARLAETLPPLTTVTPLYIRPPDALPQAGKSLPRVQL